MKDLSLEDLNQLVLFYKNKSVELEWALLLSQLESKNNIKEKIKEHEKEFNEMKTKFKDGLQDATERYNIQVDSLKKEIEKYKKKEIGNKKKNNEK